MNLGLARLIQAFNKMMDRLETSFSRAAQRSTEQKLLLNLTKRNQRLKLARKCLYSVMIT